MRRLIDVVALLTAIAVLSGILLHRERVRRFDVRVAAVGQQVRLFESTLRMRAMTAGESLNARGWPTTVDPAWFDVPPRNDLLSPDRPWVEIAPPEDASLLHPPVRVALDRSQAAFWYNPYQGVVRARVPMSISDHAALQIYNRVNQSSLTELFRLRDFARQPPLPPAEEPGAAFAAEPGAD